MREVKFSYMVFKTRFVLKVCKSSCSSAKEVVLNLDINLGCFIQLFFLHVTRLQLKKQGK